MNGNYSKFPDLDAIRLAFRALPLEDKIRFFQSELSDSGLTVIFGGSNRNTSQICVNIYNGRDLEIDRLLEAIGDWVKKSNTDNP